MRRDLLADVAIYFVTDAKPGSGKSDSDVDEFLSRVIDAGVGMVQLREKQLPDRELLSTARRFAAICRRNGALFIVNDRPDVALSSGADGVHVGQDDMHPDDVRRIVGEDFIIGASTHTPDQIDASNSSAADYIGVGPVYATPTKPGRPPVGLELVRFAAVRATKPFFAIGGIDPENAPDVRAAGSRAVSVVRSVAHADDPAAAVRALLFALAGSR